ncbi:hypothetical protein LTR56_020424 [Elasticomyces elasticus]|nr:hypothetical protein LTR56_020424 [Elasticomyces elasticus]KAK3666487.1 hypothetical protein LTR22_002792 [Elasticomyces elasticus]KAK4931307.1 hypothetical protein LTR49_002365 [Elasticomyces elasticus]KAK5767762.1 hypothetical protein LTS12_001914 [Elasticomyces elasticus]
MPPFSGKYASPPLGDDSTDALSSLSLDGHGPSKPKPIVMKLSRPDFSERSSTDPSPSSLMQGYFANVQKPAASSSNGRNRSPYNRSHLRSRSSGSALLAPAMTRAHSLPNPHLSRAENGSPTNGSTSPGGTPNSPMRTPARVRSPFTEESGYAPPPRSPGFAASATVIESIQEDTELDTSTPLRHEDTLGPLPQVPAMASFSRSGSLRRRSASPLHSLTQAPTAPTSYPDSFTSTSATNSPSLGPQRFANEMYPTLHSYGSTSSFPSMNSVGSSVPSTPTSARSRSRSPSISSLDTLDEAPDMESEAAEADHIERLKLAAERQERLERGEDADADGPRRRSSLDTDASGRRSVGFGFGRAGGSAGSRERKRWSICGGERRGDLDLETIWED